MDKDNTELGLGSLQEFKIKCVKCCCLILSTEQNEGNFRSFTIIPERAFLYHHQFGE